MKRGAYSTFAALVFYFAVAQSIGYAQCIEDRRPIVFNDATIQFRSYACRTAESSFRLEFHRFGNVPSGILVAKEASERLSQVIGRPRIITNDVFSTYSSLLRQFGRVVSTEGQIIQFSAEAGGAGGSAQGPDVFRSEAFKILPQDGGEYPAIAEIDALQAKTIPQGMKYFYTVSCQDGGTDGSRPACRKFDWSFIGMRFWRSMRADDILAYPNRIRAYNARHGAELRKSVNVPAALRFLNYLAGSVWPENFAILFGTADQDGCEAGFSYSTPVTMLEVALIENTSTSQVAVDGILGGQSAAVRLRPISASASAALARGGNMLVGSVGTLQPGDRVLVPLRIILGPDRIGTDIFSYRQTSREIQRRLGANGFLGNTGAFGVPSHTSYVYGPEIAIGGFIINGSRIELANRSANFMEITMSAEVGSCPYLLARGGDGEWVEHGKILDKAPSRELEYTEIKSFAGFKGHFRVQEREPEIAVINKVEVTLVLRGGTELRLMPHESGFAKRYGDAVRLFWGESMDIDFDLPNDVSADEVHETRLAVTGYYVRYSSLSAQRGKQRSHVWRPKDGLSTNVLMSRARTLGRGLNGVAIAPEPW
jgi:hypothetical protein